MSETYYDVLGLPKDATIEDIKKSYRKLALKTHPDKNNGDDSEFKKINTAYETLCDEELKRQYDAKLHFNPNAIHPHQFPFQQQMFFPFPFFQGFGQPNQHSFSININSVRMNQPINENEKCMTCDGKGMINLVQQQFNITIQTITQCSACNGNGRRNPNSNP
jgi:DnaJ-class molecular chaperone